MTQTVVINGAQGKMGTIACKTINENQEFDLVAALGKQDNLEATIQELKPNIVIDLTTAASVFANTQCIIANSAHPVIGTSGLVASEVAELQQLAASQHLGGIIVPNFSISAVLMMQFAQMAAKFLPEVEIIEAHHQQKLDAPSGTAIKTAEMIAAARQSPKNQLETREVIPSARGASYQDVNIHAVRLPGFLASQEVIFGNTGETLKICHHSMDRSAFMPGLILACQTVTKLDKLVYGLENIII